MSTQLMNGPIPGESLTAPVGSQPWKNPPQYVNLNDALEHVFQTLTEPRQATRLLLILKKGVPVEYLARTIIFTGFGKGMWTPDLGMMMLKSVMAMIISIAHIKKIKVTIFNPDKEQNDFLDKFMDMLPKEDLEETPQGQPENTSKMQFTGVLGGSL